MTHRHPIDTNALDEGQLGRHRDAAADALVDGTPRRVMRVSPLGGIALIGRAARQRVVHPNPLDHEHTIFELDVALGG